MTASSLRKVAAEVLTPLGWLNGTLHIPRHLPLTDYLGLGSHVLKFTHVSVPGEPDRLSFVALRRQSAVLVAPALDDAVEEGVPPAYTTDLQVACLLPMGLLRGTLRVLYNLRLSDHLQQAGQLLTLRHCLFAPYGETLNSPAARTLQVAVVNLEHVAGVSEAT